MSKYHQTEKGKSAVKKSVAKYQQTEKGKQAFKRASKKYYLKKTRPLRRAALLEKIRVKSLKFASIIEELNVQLLQLDTTE